MSLIIPRQGEDNVSMGTLIRKAILSSLLVSLSSCIFFANDDWKKEYGTPTLFLSHVDRGFYYYTSAYSSPHIYDEDFAIKNKILGAAPFNETKSFSSLPDRYFVLERRMPSTAGPNIWSLSIYEEGQIVILHKSALGPNQYAYFTLNEVKARELNDYLDLRMEQERAKEGSSFLE